MERRSQKILKKIYVQLCAFPRVGVSSCRSYFILEINIILSLLVRERWYFSMQIILDLYVIVVIKFCNNLRI